MKKRLLLGGLLFVFCVNLAACGLNAPVLDVTSTPGSQPTITRTMGITSTPTMLHVPTRRPFRTNYRIPTNTPTVTRAPTHYAGTPTPTIPLHYYSPGTVVPTSIHQVNLEQYPEYRLVSNCLDTIPRLRDLPGRSINIHQGHIDERTGNFTRQPGDFDPNSYFNIFTHLQMVEGYSLDYILITGGTNDQGMHLYARPVGDPQYSGIDDYMEYWGITDMVQAGEEIANLGGNYLDYVVGDDTPEAFYQYILLWLEGANFYSTSMCFTCDPMFLCDRYDVERTNGSYTFLTEEALDFLESLDTAPTVIVGPDVVQVRIVTYSTCAIEENLFWVSRDFPYRVLERYINTIYYFSQNDFRDHPVTRTP